MTQIIQEFGLSQAALAQALTRKMGTERVEIIGQDYRLINNDSVLELRTMKEASVQLILTSIPFSTQYEYSPNFADFGHSEGNEEFFQQFDYLTPELLRVLEPGRIAAIHVKDRIVPGGMTGLGFQTVYPFHSRCIEHFIKHRFAYMGMKTIVTDVVRENNQTYRLGWTEQCKDGSKMGVGMPEYLLLFRRPPTETKNSYADRPVRKTKAGYSRSRWQIDAHGFTRSSGNRLLSPEEISTLPHADIFKLFRDYSLNCVYDFEHHVRIGEEIDAKGRLPVTFMLLQPQSWSDEVWTDITRMLTLNGAQSAKGKEGHLCPMQFDLADRVIEQMSMVGETVLDPFGGLMTVPYRAILKGRKAIGVELSHSYFLDGAPYCKAAEEKMLMPDLFSVIELVDAVSEEAGPSIHRMSRNLEKQEA
jgi:DNA modification methylase